MMKLQREIIEARRELFTISKRPELSEAKALASFERKKYPMIESLMK